MWPNPTPMDHDLNKPESKQPENASTQVKDFLAKRFLREDL